MKVKVTPSKVHGNVKIPASKSMAHRALICASLSDGTSIVSNVTNSKDIEATVGCMKALGAKIKQLDETTYEVTGTNLFKQEGNITCNANESGSTLRFLIPLAASNVLKQLKESYPKISRATYIHGKGHEFIISSVGIDEGNTLKEKLNIAVHCSFLHIQYLPPDCPRELFHPIVWYILRPLLYF